MRKVFKYPLQMTDRQVIELPLAHEILSVQLQDGQPMLWVLVRPQEITCKVKILIAGTGHEINEDRIEFIDTFQMNYGWLVFHVFKVLD